MFIQREILTEIFAPVIWACVKEIQMISENNKLEPYEIVKIKGQLLNSLNKVLRYWEEEQTKMVSKKAKELCTHNNSIYSTCYDVTKFKYKDHDKLGGSKNNWNIRFDHTTTVSDLIKNLENCKDVETLKEELNKTSKVCIITKEENKALDDAGFKQTRDDGWESCYNKCKIEIELK